MSWPTAGLGEVCDIVSGATPKTGVEEYWDGDIAWTTPKDLSDLAAKYLSDTPRKLTESGLASCSASMLPVNSVLLSSRAPIGLVAINSIPLCTNQGFKNLIPHKERLDPEYLYWWLKSQNRELQNLGRGATFKEISKAIVSRIQIPLPPLAEQKRIAGILDAADALRAKRRESIEQLDRLIQATFLEMFGDPVTNPKGWEIVPFGSLGQSRLGKMLDAAKQTNNDRYPYLANLNVQWNRFVLDGLREMTFSATDRAEFSLEYGDILICEGGEVGRTAIWRCEKKDVYFQKALHRVRLNPEMALPEYILWYMWFMAKHGGFGDFTTSVTIAHLTGVKLKRLPVPLPPIEAQQEFASIFGAIEEDQNRQSAHSAALDTLFASLQSQAFSGAL